MAEIFHNPIDRRSFIKTSLAAMGAMVTIGTGKSFGAESDAKAVTRWAFLSDTHVPADVENNYRGFYPYQNLQKVAARSTVLNPGFSRGRWPGAKCGMMSTCAQNPDGRRCLPG